MKNIGTGYGTVRVRPHADPFRRSSGMQGKRPVTDPSNAAIPRLNHGDIHNMRKLLTVFVALAGLCGGVVMAAAQTAHTPDQAKAFVEKAIAFYKSCRQGKGVCRIQRRQRRRGSTVTSSIVVHDAKDPQLAMLAHPPIRA